MTIRYRAASGLLVLGALLGLGSAAVAAGGVNQATADNLISYVNSQGLACMSCHGVTEKKIGPAWVDVAKKYQGDPKARSEVAQRIEKGGSGIWGQTPMPPGMANHEQSEALAKMILELADK